jgi:LPS export ABC transporter protein LptC
LKRRARFALLAVLPWLLAGPISAQGPAPPPSATPEGAAADVADPAAVVPAPRRAPPATLRFGGMTFVASRGDHTEILVEARNMLVPPGAQTASLEGVSLLINHPQSGKRAFEMTCDQGDLEVETSNFRAEGNVEGRTADGRLIYTPWLRYDSDRDVISTDAPVRIVDGRHRLKGRGFIYHVKDSRFVLKGGASIVQE